MRADRMAKGPAPSAPRTSAAPASAARGYRTAPPSPVTTGSIEEVAREAARPGPGREHGKSVQYRPSCTITMSSAHWQPSGYVIDPPFWPRAISQQPISSEPCAETQGSSVADKERRKEALRRRALASLVQSARERRSGRSRPPQLRNVAAGTQCSRGPCSHTAQRGNPTAYLDALSYQQKPEFLDHMRNSAEGRKALRRDAGAW